MAMRSGIKRRRLALWRTLVPAISSVLAISLVTRLHYPLPYDAIALLWLTRLDPLLLASTLRWERTLPYWAWLPLAGLLVAAAVGRLFCGWLCPVGGLLNLLQSGREFLDIKLGLKKWQLQILSPSRGRYLWLAFLLVALLLGNNWPLLLTPYTLLSHEIDRAWTGHLPWLAITALLLGLLFYPRFWCVFVCPSGLLLSAASHWRLWRQSSAAGCSHCGRCRVDCPVQSAQPGQSAGEQCLLCGRCQDGCPSKAVRWIAGRRIHPAKKISVAAIETDLSGFSQSRRMLLKGAAATIAGAGLWFWLGRRAMAQPLRPPGALPETEFLERCARCARCIKVCPNQALQPAPLSAGLSAMETPQLVLRKGRCDLCLLCQEVCPTGAIRRLPAGKVKIGTAVLDQASCLAWQQGKYCLLCVEQCPFQAVRMDEKRRPFVRAASCIGCGACENGCPVVGAAIHVYP